MTHDCRKTICNSLKNNIKTFISEFHPQTMFPDLKRKSMYTKLEDSVDIVFPLFFHMILSISLELITKNVVSHIGRIPKEKTPNTIEELNGQKSVFTR
mmetsp:Transcript_15998/g.21436  ORF Transcript_15998/g.21436 Transcript_15998/m.21436 type:complete len:98 (-) Transcript_15998:46-339(-)